MNNIEINDKLETDIENKYIKFKENVKLTTEEAIYILKRKDFCDEVENIAIENLIQENKKLEEKQKELYSENLKLNSEIASSVYWLSTPTKDIEKQFIPKSKLKEIVELYNNTLQYTRKYNQDLADILCDLEELLEKGE